MNSADFTDDVRQSFVVAKNEIRKFLVGKKIILFGLLVLILEALNLIVPFVWGDGFYDPIYGAEALLGNINLFIVIAAVLFTATSIVSEFEERTALVLFTKPIKKWAIFLGKLMASVIIMVLFLAGLYLYAAIAVFAACGEVPGGLLPSFGLAVCGIIATTGMAIFLSSISKKGSTASIMTLVVYLLVLTIVGALIATYAKVDTWWMLDEAMSNIVNSIGVMHVLSYDPVVLAYTYVPTDELWRAAGVMWAWGIVLMVAGYFFFQKRDF